MNFRWESKKSLRRRITELEFRIAECEFGPHPFSLSGPPSEIKGVTLDPHPKRYIAGKPTPIDENGDVI